MSTTVPLDRPSFRFCTVLLSCLAKAAARSFASACALACASARALAPGSRTTTLPRSGLAGLAGTGTGFVSFLTVSFGGSLAGFTTVFLIGSGGGVFLTSGLTGSGGLIGVGVSNLGGGAGATSFFCPSISGALGLQIGRASCRERG